MNPSPGLPDAAVPPPRIDCRGVRVAFEPGQPVLRGLDLEIPSGSITCLLGPSGCGKSTLLRCIAGLLVPDAGSVTVGSAATRPLSQRLSFVFQEPTLLPWRTVRANVMLPLELQKLAAEPDFRRRVDRFLGVVGLSEGDQRKLPAQLSGGMKMRASLARALVTDPDVLLLDEPFAALDDVLRTRLNELLLELVAERPRTVVFVTHNIAEAIFLGERIAIIGQGTVRTLIDNPLPQPRTRACRSSAAFAETFGRVSAAMEGAAA